METTLQIDLDRTRDLLRRNLAGTPFSSAQAAAAGLNDQELVELVRTREVYQSPDGWFEVRSLQPRPVSGLNTPPQKRRNRRR